MDPTNPVTLTPEERAGAKLYDGNAAKQVGIVDTAIESRSAELWGETGANTAQREQLRNTYSAIEASSRLPSAVLVRIIDQDINVRLAAVRPVGDPDAAKHDLATRIAESNTETRRALRDQYGAKEAEELLERASRFVAATPALAQILANPLVGSDPAIVQGIVSYVFSNGLGRVNPRSSKRKE